MLGSGLEGTANEGWFTRNNFGLRTKEVQMTICEFRLSQEDRKFGSGPDRPSTQPQREKSHDQKKGVRIRESRIPAQSETLPTSPLGSLRGSHGRSTRRTMSSCSRKPDSPGSRSGGPKVRQPSKDLMQFSPRQWDQSSKDKAWEESESWSSTPGRWIHAVTEGTGGAGLHLFSDYGCDTGKPDHDRLNMELDQE
eukprot:16434657-Heterocapsa_arctica.AAC.1